MKAAARHHRRTDRAVGYGHFMEMTTPVGIAVAVIALFLIFKVGQTIMKVVLLLVVAVGLYIAFGDQLPPGINPFD